MDQSSENGWYPQEKEPREGAGHGHSVDVASDRFKLPDVSAGFKTYIDRNRYSTSDSTDVPRFSNNPATGCASRDLHRNTSA